MTDEELLAKMSKLVHMYPSVGAMLGADALRDVPTAHIQAAFQILEKRGPLSLGESVQWRERAPKEYL